MGTRQFEENSIIISCPRMKFLFTSPLGIGIIRKGVLKTC
jgi:hypothetical protein